MASIKSLVAQVASKNSIVRRWHILRTGRQLFREHPEWGRFADDWYSSRLEKRSSLADQRPWLTYPTLIWMNEKDWSGKRIFEWGGGGSTLFFLRSGASVVTIEHDRQWADEIHAAVESHGYKNLDLRLHEPVPCRSHASQPQYTSSTPRFLGHNFENYVKTIDDFQDNSFDLILIDGRSRAACLQHAISKVAEQGTLMFDNADRPGYQAAIEAACKDRLASWKRIDLSGPTPYLWGSEATTLALVRDSFSRTRPFCHA